MSLLSGRLVTVWSGWDPEGMTEVSGLAQLLATSAGARPLTVEDLFELPDDSWRYELVDGSLIMSPPPPLRHDNVSHALLRLLWATLGPDRVRKPDSGIVLDDGTFLIPDLIVLSASADLTGKGYRVEDVELVVEVVSPTNAANDLVLKRHVYARHGIGHYWLVDSRDELRITVLRLDGSGKQYEVEHEIAPGETVVLTHPFPITLAPVELSS